MNTLQTSHEDMNMGFWGFSGPLEDVSELVVHFLFSLISLSYPNLRLKELILRIKNI